MQGQDEPIYDTDHTDLNSDFDEVELRAELLKDVSNKPIVSITHVYTTNDSFLFSSIEMAIFI